MRNTGALLVPLTVALATVLIASPAAAATASIQRFSLPDPGYSAFALAPGPDGNIWFAAKKRVLQRGEPGCPADPSNPDQLCRGARKFGVGRITPSGVVTIFELPPNPCGDPTTGVSAGPDGNIWFTQGSDGASTGVCNEPLIGRMTTSGTVTGTWVPRMSPLSIMAGPDGQLYYTGFKAAFFTQLAELARITTDGQITTVAEGSGLGIGVPIVGHDGHVWAGVYAIDPASPYYGKELLRVPPNGDATAVDAPRAYGSMDPGPDGTFWDIRYQEPASDDVKIPARSYTGRYGDRSVEHELIGGDDDFEGRVFKPADLATGGDGNLWITGSNDDGGGNGGTTIRRVTPEGIVDDYASLMRDLRFHEPGGIVSGPDGALWATAYDIDSEGGGQLDIQTVILRITPGDPPGGSAAGKPLVLDRLTLRPKVFRAKLTKARDPIDHDGTVYGEFGSELHFNLSLPAKVSFGVQRASPGRKVGQRCRKPTPANRGGRRCMRLRKLRGGFSEKSRRGRSDGYTFTGTLRARKLAPGDYRLTAIAETPSGRRSKPKSTTFRIVGKVTHRQRPPNGRPRG